MIGTHTIVPFIGRWLEFERLHSLVDEVSRGGGRIAVIEGEAGIGKSRLLEAMIETASKLGFQVCAGKAHDLERDRAFGLVVDTFGLHRGALEPLEREIASLIEGEGHGSDTRYGIVERVAELVETAALHGPLLLALEDLHWADPSSILTLHRLATSIRHLSVLIVCTTRLTPRSTDLTGLLGVFDTAGSIRVQLGPLDDESVSELVTATLGLPPGPRLVTKVAGAAGNPLFVSELLAALSQEGLIETKAETADVADVSTPPSLTLTILRRLAFLSEESLGTLRVASVLGAAFTLKDLAIVVERPASSLLPAIEEARAAALLAESGDLLVFRHELVRDAIYEDMLQPIRKALHAQAAHALAEAGASTAQVATHAAIGAEVGDLAGIEWLRRAAVDALTRSPSVALQLIERAIELAGDEAGRRDPLELFYAKTLVLAQRPIDASKVVRELLSRPIDRETRIEAQRTLFRALEMQGRWRDAVEEIDGAAEDPSLTAVEQARLVAARADAMHGYDRTQARPEAERAIDLGERAGDELTVFIGMQTLAFCNGFDGYLDEALDLVDKASERAAGALAADARAVDVRVNRCLYLAWGDRFEEAEVQIRGTSAVNADDADVSMLTYHYTKAHIDLWAGRWDEAIAVAEAGVAVAEETGLVTEKAHLIQVLCYIALHRDDLTVAESYVREIPSALWIPALLAEAKSDQPGLAGALERYQASVYDPSPWHMSLVSWWGPDWVRLYLDAGDRDSALVMTKVLEDAAGRLGTATARGAALRCRGLYEDSAVTLLSAVDVYEDSPRVFDRGQACEWAAASLAKRGDTSGRAVALLERAIGIYEDLVAMRGISRAEAKLRDLGVRRGRRGPRQRPKSGWESLTPSELRVTELVAEGLAYREIGDRLFISRRTVETHVAHVFFKLGLSSRRELADIARQR